MERGSGRIARPVGAIVALVLAAGAVGATLLLVAAPALAAKPTNDRLKRAEVIETLPFSAGPINLSRATTDRHDPRPDCTAAQTSVWYRLDAATNGAIAVTVTPADIIGDDPTPYVTILERLPNGRLRPLGCAVRIPDEPDVRLAAPVKAGRTYLVQVGVAPQSQGGTVNLAIENELPANDFQSRAAEVGALPFDDRGVDLSLASVEGTAVRNDGMLSACDDMDGTVWYRWSPLEDGAVTLVARPTQLGDNDPQLIIAAYEVGSRDRLRPLGCAPSGLGGEARLSLPVEAGTGYWFQVGTGAYGRIGLVDVHLDAQVPANDFLLRATPVPPGGFTDPAVDLSLASAEKDEPAPECFEPAGTVWYAATPDMDGDVTVELTPGPDLDPQYVAIALWAAPDAGSGTPRSQLACTVAPDDGGPIAMSAPVAAGEPVLVQVGYDAIGWGGPVDVSIVVPGPGASPASVSPPP
ncbi:MAG: hypothetical protein U0869_22230 [Chloroflexota bacterium]